MAREFEIPHAVIGSSPEKALERDFQKKATDLLIAIATIKEVKRDRDRINQDYKPGVTATISSLVAANLLWKKYTEAQENRDLLVKELIEAIPEDVHCAFEIPVNSEKVRGIRSIIIDGYNKNIQSVAFNNMETTTIYSDGKFAS